MARPWKFKQVTGSFGPDVGRWKPIIRRLRAQMQAKNLFFSIVHGAPWEPRLVAGIGRRDVRVAEGARLESVCGGNLTEGSNPSLSAKFR